MRGYSILGKSFLCLLILSTYSFAQFASHLIPKEEPFYIQSAVNYGKNIGGYWDIPGGEENIREKAPIQVYDLVDKKQDRRYVIVPSPKTGWVKI